MMGMSMVMSKESVHYQTVRFDFHIYVSSNMYSIYKVAILAVGGPVCLSCFHDHVEQRSKNAPDPLVILQDARHDDGGAG